MFFDWHNLVMKNLQISMILNETWNKIMQEVWVKPSDDKYFFKKSLATSYAVAVVVHMNLICEQLKNEK